jgi:hypothetical protein
MATAVRVVGVGVGGGVAVVAQGTTAVPQQTVWAVMLAVVVLVLTLALMVALLKMRHPRGVTQTLPLQAWKP